MQQNYEHRVPKTNMYERAPRVNLTWRWLRREALPSDLCGSARGKMCHQAETVQQQQPGVCLHARGPQPNVKHGADATLREVRELQIPPG